MQNAEDSLPFHFFGNVWFEEPRNFLDEDEYQALQRYMPMIQALDREWRQRSRFDWDLDSRFNSFVHKEMQAWRRRGVERPAQFLLRPSGSIAAPIAHHLLNPTFYVANPYSRDTDDPSSPTMYLLHENGLSSQNSFMFDQVCRREDTGVYVRLWTDDVQKPHDDFVRELRQNMSAIVEVCWGEVVWRRLEREVQLVRLPLWGKHKEVKLYLELDADANILKRFVLWVHHPQYFFRPTVATTTNGVPKRAIQATVQDRALALAASLVNLSIKRNFYEKFPRNRYPRLTKEQREIHKSLMDSAREELRAAFPIEAKAEEERRSRLEGRRKEKSQQIRIILQCLEKEARVHVQRGSVEPDREGDDLELCRLERQTVQHLTESLLAVSQSVSYYKSSPDPLAEGPGNLENVALADSDWFDLPTELIGWLQCQAGLKIGGKAMESRRELERAFQLLRCGEKSLYSGRIDSSTIGELALKVAWTYIEFLTRKRRPSILELTVPGAPGSVIQRKCSSCGQRVLDDAFPRFAKRKCATYVVRTLEVEGCGLPGCKGRTDLIPIDEWQPHIRGVRKVLEKPPKTKGRGDFNSFLCRSEEELNGLPKTVQTTCMVCGCPKLCGYARWTIEKEPHFVIPRLKCKGCKGEDRNFRPVEKWRTINETVLSKFWKKVKSANFNPMDDPAVRRSFFGQGDFDTMKAVLKKLTAASGGTQAL